MTSLPNRESQPTPAAAVTPSISLRENARLLARAFQDDPGMRYLVPDVADREALLPEFFRFPLGYGQHYGVVSAGEAGVSIWIAPEHVEATPWKMLRAGVLALPWRVGPTYFGRFVKFMECIDGVHAELVPTPHWYLFVLGVEPRLQGRGVGSAALRENLARIDEKGLPTYLETMNPANVRLYERFGFRVVREAKLPDETTPFWAMLRDATR